MDGLRTNETNEMLNIGESNLSRKKNQVIIGDQTTLEFSTDKLQVRIPVKSLSKPESFQEIFVDEREQKTLKVSFRIEPWQKSQLKQPRDKIQWIMWRIIFSLNFRKNYNFLRNFGQFSMIDIIPAASSLLEQGIENLKSSSSPLFGVKVNEIFAAYHSSSSFPLSGVDSLIIDTLSLIQGGFTTCNKQLRYLLQINEQTTLFHDSLDSELRAPGAPYKVYVFEWELLTYRFQGKCITFRILFKNNLYIPMTQEQPAKGLHSIQFKDCRLQCHVFSELVFFSLISITTSIRPSLNILDPYHILIKPSRVSKKKGILPKEIVLDGHRDLALHSRYDNSPFLSNQRLGIICPKEQLYGPLSPTSLENLSAFSVWSVLQLPQKIHYTETATKFRSILLYAKLSRQVETQENKPQTHLGFIYDTFLKPRILQQQKDYKKLDSMLEKCTCNVDIDPMRSTRFYSSYDGTADEEEKREPKPSFLPKTKIPIGKSVFDQFSGNQETENAWRLAIENRTLISSDEICIKLPISEARQDNFSKIMLGHDFSAPEKSTISVFTDIRIKNREESKREKQIAASEQYRKNISERVAKKKQVIKSWEAELEATALLAQANTRAIFKKEDPAVIDKRFPAAWSRYSSHDRIERLTNTLSLEGVKVRDFATNEFKNNEISLRVTGDTSKEKVNAEDYGQRNNLRRKLQNSATLFLYKTKLNDVHLQAGQAQGRRGSLNVAGEMEYPELELLPFTLMTDVEIENEVKEENERIARLRYTENMEKHGEENIVKILKKDGDAGKQRLTEEALLTEEQRERGFESRLLSVSDIVLSKDVLNVVIVDEVDMTSGQTSPCLSISEILFSMV